MPALLKLAIVALRFITLGNPSTRQMVLRALGIGVFVFGFIIVLNNVRDNSAQVASPSVLPTVRPLNARGTLEVNGRAGSARLAEGHRDEWLFEGRAGQQVDITLVAGWQSTLYLITPARGRYDLEARQQNLGGREYIMICGHPLALSGFYRVEVMGTINHTDVNYGDYTLFVADHDPDEGCPTRTSVQVFSSGTTNQAVVTIVPPRTATPGR